MFAGLLPSVVTRLQAIAIWEHFRSVLQRGAVRRHGAGLGPLALQHIEHDAGGVGMANEPAGVMPQLPQGMFVNAISRVACVSNVADIRADCLACRFVCLDATDDAAG